MLRIFFYPEYYRISGQKYRVGLSHDIFDVDLDSLEILGILGMLEILKIHCSANIQAII